MWSDQNNRASYAVLKIRNLVFVKVCPSRAGKNFMESDGFGFKCDWVGSV
jgi:hypothetical protein